MAGLGRLRLRHAQVDQARLLAAGHDLDRMPQRGFRRHQEGLRRRQPAHGVGGHRAHAVRRDVADALAEPRQALQRALPHRGVEPALAVQALGHAHGFAQAVDDAQLAQGVAGHDHVVAVGPQVDRGQHVAVDQGLALRGRRGSGAHPQISASSADCAECGVSPSAGESWR